MPLAHITLATRDVHKAEAFFAGALGWRPIRRPGNVGRPAAWLEIAPGQELHLVEVAGFEPSPFEAEFGRHVATGSSSLPRPLRRRAARRRGRPWPRALPTPARGTGPKATDQRDPVSGRRRGKS
jgi:catechol 2,3-dioxygenase-like lactoylglutathione lyase family enzyme